MSEASTLIMNKDLAVLQGAFLRADKLSLPSVLSTIQKADWSRVKEPVLQALRETCGFDEAGDQPSPSALAWKKRIVCVVWLKLLSREAEEDVEKAWMENPFFSLQNSLPELNHVVLLELVKSTSAAKVFVSFLLCLPHSQICTELERLAEHLRTDPTGEDDVLFLLDVWWELWKGRGDDSRKEGSIEMMFANQFARLSAGSPQLSPQAAKRLKMDTSDSPASSTNTEVLHVLLHALKGLSDHVSSTDLCLLCMSVCLDALLTSFLTEQEVVLPVEDKLHIICKAVTTKSNNETLNPELIQETLRDLRASCSPSLFKPSRTELSEALKIVTELSQFWQEKGLFRVHSGSDPSYPTFRLQLSVQSVLTALDKVPEALSEKNTLKSFLKSLDFPAKEISAEVQLQVTAAIISHCLEGYESFAQLFVSQASWAYSNQCWMDCLEKNQAAFRQPTTLLRLSSALVTQLKTESLNLSQSRRGMKVTADIFSALSLEDKNKVLAATLRLSSRGFFSCSVPPAVTDSFQQELNMVFNCIIQGGERASVATPQGSLSTAVSLVSRVAFQNPEAALKSCCHSAVFNKGAFCLMAKILQQLPGLRGQRRGKEEEGREDDDVGGGSLFCRCLQETTRTKSLSVNDKEQLLRFLGLLMTSDVTSERGERQNFLSPQEVVKTFILPNLSVKGNGSIDTDFSLKLLHSSLSVDVQDSSTSPHWIMDCSPFPLLYVLAQIYNQTFRCWKQPPGGGVHLLSMDTKELLESVLTIVGQVVGAEVAAAPSSWSRALFWLHNKVEQLDWTVGLHLKPVWGQHFKQEVPLTLLDVCHLPEQEWSGLELAQYGQGTGLLAWMECCSVSDSLQSVMLSGLSLDQRRLDHVSMFSKGLLVTLTQTIPWCSASQWSRLLRVLKELIDSKRLSVPISLEYVDYLPLLDLRQFSCELRMSVLLLRVLQLLCGSSCSDWLSAEGWAHVGRLYAQAVREMMSSIKTKLPLHSQAPVSVLLPPSASRDPNPSLKVPKTYTDPQNTTDPPQTLNEWKTEEEVLTAPSQEVLFVLSQLFCHVQHIQVMMPGGQSEPLFLCSLEILSHYEAIMAAFPDSCSPAETDNTRHFFSTITDNLDNQEMKAVLQQKITQLVSSAA
ncbi:gem-associated protein 4 [Austrofundulus limnaeus]|uniref:Gem-associated protein 4 n=1 Tax=Austrofundulus limnaeus TaxID=52670 RepID=A0A2I4CMN2_AUSLI|nr:PREDICTED: gem-associated protein 4 [Austrofundulus limnaeus]